MGIEKLFISRPMAPWSDGTPEEFKSCNDLILSSIKKYPDRFIRKMYPKESLDYGKYMEENQCPENDRLCNEEAVWFFQNMLLGSRTDMDDIVMAVEKIQQNAGKIMKTGKV